MDYKTIKQRAKQQAETMHNEWLEEHFTGLTVSDEEVERTRHEEDPERDYASDLKRKLALGELLPDEVEDSLTFILYKALQNRTYDEWRDPTLLLSDASTVNSTKSDQRSPDRFSEHIEAFLADKKAFKKQIKESTLDAYRDSFRLFIEVMGDVVISELTYRDGASFRDQLLKLPTHRKKKEEYRDKSIAELLAADINPDDCISARTIFEHLNYLKIYLSWLTTTDIIKANPFEKVSIEFGKNPYSAYTTDDYNRIFLSPLFIPDSQFCKRWARRSHWWLLTLGIFTGARISEIMQLTTEDLIEKDGVLGLSLLDEEETKNLKSAAARRFVPVHPQLKDFGLEEYVTQLKSGFLIPEIPHGSRKAGEQASKWYNEKYRERYLSGFKEDRKVYHSFRHTFIRVATRCGADLTKLQAIVGHEPTLMGSTKSYMGDVFNRYTGAQLAEQMSLVKFDGIKTDHLNWRAIVRR